jgi:L-serine dehydratase
MSEKVRCFVTVPFISSLAAGGLPSRRWKEQTRRWEHTAEIAMEDNLGVTCDPVVGLVQIPFSGRNAFGAVKAVSAARMAMQETPGQKVSPDQAIRTMYQTGVGRMYAV